MKVTGEVEERVMKGKRRKRQGEEEEEESEISR